MIANLKTLDVSKLKKFDFASLKSVSPETPTADLRPMVEGRSIRTKVERQKYITCRNARRASAQIGRLPERGEALHLLLAANSWAVFDALPAIIDLAGESANEVVLATLGIASRHVRALDEMFKTKLIRHCSLLLSHYFSRVDKGEFAEAVEVFQRHGFPIKEARSHAKVIAVRFPDGRHIVCESSGNLRSCRAVEVLTMTDDRRLYRWHREWIRQMLAGTK